MARIRRISLCQRYLIWLQELIRSSLGGARPTCNYKALVFCRCRRRPRICESLQIWSLRQLSRRASKVPGGSPKSLKSFPLDLLLNSAAVLAAAITRSMQALATETEIQQIQAEACPHCAMCGCEGEIVHARQHDRLVGAEGLWNLK